MMSTATAQVLYNFASTTTADLAKLPIGVATALKRCRFIKSGKVYYAKEAFEFISSHYGEELFAMRWPSLPLVRSSRDAKCYVWLNNAGKNIADNDMIFTMCEDSHITTEAKDLAAVIRNLQLTQKLDACLPQMEGQDDIFDVKLFQEAYLKCRLSSESEITNGELAKMSKNLGTSFTNLLIYTSVLSINAAVKQCDWSCEQDSGNLRMGFVSQKHNLDARLSNVQNAMNKPLHKLITEFIKVVANNAFAMTTVDKLFDAILTCWDTAQKRLANGPQSWNERAQPKALEKATTVPPATMFPFGAPPGMPPATMMPFGHYGMGKGQMGGPYGPPAGKGPLPANAQKLIRDLAKETNTSFRNFVCPYGQACQYKNTCQFDHAPNSKGFKVKGDDVARTKQNYTIWLTRQGKGKGQQTKGENQVQQNGAAPKAAGAPPAEVAEAATTD